MKIYLNPAPFSINSISTFGKNFSKLSNKNTEHPIKRCGVNLAKKLIVGSLITAVVFGILTPFNAIFAQAIPLSITSITITPTDNTATISWTTNRNTIGKIQYGTTPDTYTGSVSTNIKKDSQTVTISGLSPETNYFIRITAEDGFAVVQSNEQKFKTLKNSDNVTPTISSVRLVYITGTTATVQWETDEPATSEVLYGVTESYGRSKISSTKTRVHDITLTGLAEATTYNFRVRSKDANNNTAQWFNMSFRTILGTHDERAELKITDITPISENDINVGKNSAIIAWRTNKLTEGFVRYGTTPTPRTKVNINPPRSFAHNVSLTGLQENTTYYFDITVQDVFGKDLTSQVMSFKTKGGATTSNGGNTGTYTPTTNTPGTVLGAATCSVNLSSDFGYWGAYFNLPSTHPDVRVWKGDEIPHALVARENDWYSAKYFRFDRIDPNLKFGNGFFPIDGDQPGDPNFFAVEWRAIISVPANGSYNYTITSDDDSWVFVDGNLMTNLSGIHRAKTETKSLTLSQGYHTLEIYYADRARSQANMSFETDTRLKIHPLPGGCNLSDVLFFNGSGGNDNGVVLGSSNEDDLDYTYTNTGAGTNGTATNSGTTTQPTYACNPNLGYTKIKALYKTTASPDIWAILETGQKHYITSPQSFALYQCDWSKIKVVSQKFLDGFNNATLVRTPDNATVYHLFDRPLTQWLKINMPSPTVFVSYENNFWGNVARINHLDMASYPNVRYIKSGNNATVYLIDGQYKKPFTSAEQFTSLGNDWVEVVTLNQVHLDSYLTTTAVQ